MNILLILWEQSWEHFIIMKITFKFRSRKRKQDGFQELLIRLRNGRQNDKIVCTGIYLNSKYWTVGECFKTRMSLRHPKGFFRITCNRFFFHEFQVLDFLIVPSGSFLATAYFFIFCWKCALCSAFSVVCISCIFGIPSS